jgi:ABC-2 type transport system permease protein
MKNKMIYLIKYSLYKKMKSKWFVVVNLLLLLLIVGLTNIENVIAYFGGDFDREVVIEVIDKTGTTYPIFEAELNKHKEENGLLSNVTNFSLTKHEVNEEENLIEKLKENGNILIIIEEDENNYIKSKLIANKFSDQILYQVLLTTLNNTKMIVALSSTDIPMEEFNKIYSPISIEQVTLSEEKEKSTELIMGTVFPTLIVPFFMLVVFVVQMIGLEITEEKTTKGMEIIISNVSPQVHFFSKVIAANTFVISQALLLLIYGGIGLMARNIIGNSTVTGSIGIEISKLWDQIAATGVTEQLTYVIPLTLILFILSFILYSLIAGIFASITVNVEDYQQIQFPIVILLLTGYYLSMLAGIFQGASFIKIMSYIPFFSALLSPALLI